MQDEVLADPQLIAPTVIVNRRPGIVAAEIRHRRRRTTIAVIAECQSQLPRVPTVEQLAHLKAALTGDAGQVLWDTDPVAIDSLSKLTTLLRSRFSGSRQADM